MPPFTTSLPLKRKHSHEHLLSPSCYPLAMHPTNVRQLADALVRHNGTAKAIVIAPQYVPACIISANSDTDIIPL